MEQLRAFLPLMSKSKLSTIQNTSAKLDYMPVQIFRLDQAASHSITPAHYRATSLLKPGATTPRAILRRENRKPPATRTSSSDRHKCRTIATLV